LPDGTPYTYRRFPRTLRDAFPAERFPALEIPPEPSTGDRAVGVVLAIAAVVVLWILAQF
jgi:hypothetical protein